MVYEWIPVVTPSPYDTFNFDCASGVAIAKGTLLTLMDEKRVGATSAAGQMVAGVAAMDKSGSDNTTTISVYIKGVFEATASGALVLGQGWETAAQGNTVRALTQFTASGAAIGGISWATASAGEVVNLLLDPGKGGSRT